MTYVYMLEKNLYSLTEHLVTIKNVQKDLHYQKKLQSRPAIQKQEDSVLYHCT